MTELIVGAVVLFAAGLIQGCTGFGLALVAAPCLLMIIEPRVVTPTLVLLSMMNTALVAWHARRHVRAGLVIPLALGGVAGFPLGIYVLKTLDAEIIKVCVGAFVVAFALLLLTGWRKPLRNDRLARFPVGVASGILGGATSMGGPPVILFLANQNMPKDVFRGNIVCYFLVVNCFGIAMYLASDLLTWQVMRNAAAFTPTMLVGAYCGIWAAKHLGEKLFRTLAMAAVAVMGIVLLGSSIHGLL